VPYRVDLSHAPADALDRLIDLGALDVDTRDHHVIALLPDDVTIERVSATLGRNDVRATPARGRDGNSVWILHPRPVRVGRLHLFPATWPSPTDGLRLTDDAAFGTGLHATTALCLERLEAELTGAPAASVLDVGTGSGVLALAALWHGVPEAMAVDIDADALRVAADNALLNGLTSRLRLVQGGPEVVPGAWPLVVANILAAPLIDMAPALAQKISHNGRLVLSGIRASLAGDVSAAYKRPGLRLVDTHTREGWTALTFQAPW